MALMVGVWQSFLVVYGGVDMERDVVFGDAYGYWEGMGWREIRVDQGLSPRVNMRHAKCGDRILLFGG